MKATGIVRKVDELGRIVLPKELRRIRHINEGDPIEIFVDDNLIILHKYQPALGIINDIERLIAKLSDSQEFMSDEEMEIAQEIIGTLQKIQVTSK
ncbi:AbrB/MazE/SpoVT family DNA-binding domain-containing protein [Clostridium aminobutyricum]|uniref:AbrB/MazE/SpoVT family DNA-binding domain-containing protein n=1 Tax=Clostridium aminobutyricum TaxID=33953 RepID=A0A939D925_CLOAM|nr:AbrB/MazE/SpoVT family DNA-binding domain-containing protein [Clostridium aminobutyricum]MBN7773462.1 AbrB/MazE/SpoVT family DNA-binding domain-containing protein [Clostridium aminobutyricum]